MATSKAFFQHLRKLYFRLAADSIDGRASKERHHHCTRNHY